MRETTAPRASVTADQAGEQIARAERFLQLAENVDI